MSRHQAPVMRSLSVLTGLASLVLLGGCPTSVDPDGGVDAQVDDAPRLDAGRDASDAGIDVGPLVAPPLRNEVEMDDLALAREALRLMGAPQAGGSGSCHTCHGITRESIAHFADLTDAAWSTCFTDLALETPAAAETALSCMRNALDRYSATRMGILSAGARLPWFTYAMQRARGGGWEAELERLLDRGAMPPSGEAWDQGEFDIVTEWFLRGTPNVDDVLDPTMPSDCTPRVGPEVVAIVEDSAATGWAAVNEANGILMHGCAGATNPRECLASYPDAADRPIGEGWSIVSGSTARILYETSYRSSYWTRSSPDGRFVAHGGGSAGATIIDLMRGVAIGADALYDPGFFPDNSGLMFQGGGTHVCELSVLTTGAPTLLTLTEPGCTNAIGVPLYQHMGASLAGGDYWAVSSTWSGDPGGLGADPTIFTDAGSTARFHSMRNTGSGFAPGPSTVVSTPNEGSAILAPSMRMLVTQIANASGEPVGYVVRGVTITSVAGGHTITAPEIARYCYPGGKPAVSLDDRWLVTHHRADDSDAVDLGFTGPDDPGFAPYRGVSNVYLIDLTTGVRTRVTNMAPGQEALFPHFRSDGWLYFLVRNGAPPEYIVATDAALVLAE